MAIAPTLQRYFEKQQIMYDVVQHEPTMSSTRTAEACHVSGNCLAKGVLLRDGAGYILAVLPASRHIRLSDLQEQLGKDVRLAEEPEVEACFQDCERGAVPPVGSCYGLDVIIDESLKSQPEVYFEAGDHATLVHMRQDQFSKLNGSARRGRFSVHQDSVSVH